jgi:hypothetical protein
MMSRKPDRPLQVNTQHVVFHHVYFLNR